MTHLTLSSVSADHVCSSSEFTGKVALVTSGASGIGAAIARCLCAAGATTLLVDRDLAAASRTAAEISADGGKALPIAADVSVIQIPWPVLSRPAVLWVENCTLPSTMLASICHAAGQGIIRSSVLYAMAGYEIPSILQSGGGAIMNVASVMGHRGIAGQPAYTAAKHGVVGLTKAAALDYAGQKLRINAVALGFIETPLLRHLSPVARAGGRCAAPDWPTGAGG